MADAARMAPALRLVRRALESSRRRTAAPPPEPDRTAPVAPEAPAREPAGALRDRGEPARKD